MAYSELRAHIEKLGLTIKELENCEKLKPFDLVEETNEFKWREMGPELILHATASDGTHSNKEV